MDAFDRFLIGDNNISINFENSHFIQRLNKYRIQKRYIIDTVLEEEPIRYDTSGPNQYEVIYKAPPNKDYKEVRIIMACTENRVDILTIIPEGRTQKQKNKYADEEYKKLEKKRNKAYAKRKKLY